MQRAYNTSKYRVLVAILYMESHRIMPTAHKISKITGLSKWATDRVLRLNVGRYLVAKKRWKMEDRAHMYYTLNKHGKIVYNMFTSNYMRGLELKISKHQIPRKFDYSDFVLLPGLLDFNKEYGITPAENMAADEQVESIEVDASESETEEVLMMEGEEDGDNN